MKRSLVLTGRRSGIALAITMMLIVLLTIFIGAFSQIYRSHFSLTHSSMASQSASLACDAVYQYVSFRLEHNRGWGVEPFGSDGKDDYYSPEMTVVSIPNSSNFRGTIQSLDAEFHATITNNLLATGASNPLAPKGTSYCVVTATCRGSTRTARFLLGIAPLFDSSVLTRQGLIVGSQKVAIRSTDPKRNFIRAEKEIEMPGLLDGHITEFLNKDGSGPDTSGTGMLWAKGKISSIGSGSKDEIDNTDDLGKAMANSHGKIVPNAKSHFPIFEIDEKNLEVPSGATTVSLAGEPYESKGGRWTFVRRLSQVTYGASYGGKFPDSDDHVTAPASGTAWVWADVLEFYKDADSPPYAKPGDTPPTRIYRGAQRIEDIRTSVPNSREFKKGDGDDDKANFDLDPNSITVTDLKVLAYGSSMGIDIIPTDTKTYGGGELSFDLTNQKVTADANATIEVDGPFCVTSEQDNSSLDSYVADYPNLKTYLFDKDGKPILDSDGNQAWKWNVAGSRETPPPVLNLGYEEDSSAEGGVKKATIITKDQIEIKNGITEGLGRLISKTGDISIQPKNTKALTINPKLDGAGLLIYAGQNVNLTNPNGTTDWSFKGLVYAQGGINMDGGGTAKATFEGTIVSLGSDINFKNCQFIDFLYNPDLLSAYVKALPDDRIQIETVYWTR